MAYPQVLADRLAEGKTIMGVTPNLVDDNGNSNIPDGVKTTFKFSHKATDNLQVLKSTDSGATWSVITNHSIDYTANTITFSSAPASTDLFLISNESSNPAYTQADPLPVLEVQPKVIATNSHSIYKGANVGNSNGYIQVGDGANGLESRVLENGEIYNGYYDYDSTNTSFTFENGKIFYVDRVGYFQSGQLGSYYMVINGDGSVFGIPSVFDLEGSDYTELSTTPQHPTLSLDNSTAIANKYFKTIAEEDGELVSQVFIESMEWDFDADSEPEFIPVTSEDTLYAYVKDSLYHIGMVDNVGLSSYTLRCLYTGTYRLKYLQKSGSYWLDDNGVKMFEDWDGNGFGDNGEFEQLTNGTNIDLNGNTTRTFVGKISLGVNK